MIGTKVLEVSNSKYNKDIKVLKTFGMGTYIQVNGLTQSGGIVESIWKQTLNKIKSKNIEKIVVLGLGGGTLAKLLRKKYPKAKITGVEIDPVMIELGKKYLSLDKYDIDIKIGDALNYNLNDEDLVIIDTYLGDDYVELKNLNLKKGKLFIFNRLSFKGKKDEALKFGEKLKKSFKKVEIFYPTANMMFICYNS